MRTWENELHGILSPVFAEKPDLRCQILHCEDKPAMRIRCWVAPLIDVRHVAWIDIHYSKIDDKKYVTDRINELIAAVREVHATQAAKQSVADQGVQSPAVKVPGEAKEELLPIRETQGR